MLHVNHPLLQFADITDPLLSNAALFFRFYSYRIQIWAMQATSYLARWVLRSDMQYAIEIGKVKTLYDICVRNFLRNLTVEEFCWSVYICRSYDQKSSILFFLTHDVVYRSSWNSLAKQPNNSECQAMNYSGSGCWMDKMNVRARKVLERTLYASNTPCKSYVTASIFRTTVANSQLMVWLHARHHDNEAVYSCYGIASAINQVVKSRQNTLTRLSSSASDEVWISADECVVGIKTALDSCRDRRSD